MEAVWHLYVIRTEHRNGLKERLASKNINAGIHYPVPIHLQPAYQDLGYKQGDFPVTEAHADKILSLPMYAELTESQIEFVAQTIFEFQSPRQTSAAASESPVRQVSPSI